MQPEHPLSNRLDTNYAATTAEIPEIKKLIQDYQSTVDGLDDELSKLDLRRQELEEKKHTSCESIKKLRSIMSCTRRIPADILSTIFSDLLHIEGPEAAPYPAVTVSHVCRLWRDIALDNPLLWTNLIVNIPPYPLPVSGAARASTLVGESLKEDSEVYENRMVQFQRRTSSIPDRLAAFATRSAQCPLLFSLQAHDDHPLGMPCEALEDAAEFQDVIDSIFDVALDTCHRWETVRISLRVNSCMPIQLPLVVFAQLSGANTRTLELDLEYYGISDMFVVWAKLGEKVNVLQSPLKSLTVRMTCTDIHRVEVGWGQLTDLTLALRYDGTNRLFDSILGVLKRTRNLRQLSLQFIGKLEEVNSRTPPICLQHLERLAVKGTAPSTEFAASLDFPILTSFSFPRVIWSPRSAGGIIEWIRRYGRQLTHVSFDYTNFSEASLVWILTNIPNANSLQIHCFHATDVDAEFVLPNGARAEPPKISPQLLEMLTPKMNESKTDVVGECLCPRLERLAWTFGRGHGQAVKGSIVDLISSRRSVPHDGSGLVSWLKEVEVVFIMGTTDGMLDQLRHRGVELRGVKLSGIHMDTRSKALVHSIPIPGMASSVVMRSGLYNPIHIIDI